MGTDSKESTVPWADFANCADSPLHLLFLGQHSLPSVTVAMELGLFDLLSRNPCGLTADGIISSISVGKSGGAAILSILSSLGMVRILMGKYVLTDIASTYLVSSSPHYWGGYILRPEYPPHQRLKSAIANELARGKHGHAIADAWASGSMSRDAAEQACRRMHAHSLFNANAVATTFDFRKLFLAKSVLDLGGGSGVFSIALAKHQPGLACTVGELPVVCQVVEQDYIPSVSLPANSIPVKTIGVDFFKDEIPSGYDCIFLSNILHDWNFDTCESLCKKIYKSLPSGGHILIFEALLDDDACGPLRTALFSMHMYLFTEGQQFTLKQLSDILIAVGFDKSSIVARPGSDTYSLISARRP